MLKLLSISFHSSSSSLSRASGASEILEVIVGFKLESCEREDRISCRSAAANDGIAVLSSR